MNFPVNLSARCRNHSPFFTTSKDRATKWFTTPLAQVLGYYPRLKSRNYSDLYHVDRLLGNSISAWVSLLCGGFSFSDKNILSSQFKVSYKQNHLHQSIFLKSNFSTESTLSLLLSYNYTLELPAQDIPAWSIKSDYQHDQVPKKLNAFNRSGIDFLLTHVLAATTCLQAAKNNPLSRAANLRSPNPAARTGLVFMRAINHARTSLSSRTQLATNARWGK